MKKILLLGLLAGWGISYGQRAETVIAGHIKAIGGLKAVQSVETKMLEAMIDGQGGTITIKNYWKRPGQYSSIMTLPDGNEFVTLMDKGVVKQKMGDGDATEIAAEHANDQKANEADIDGVLIGYEQKGHKVTLEGTEKIGDKEAFKLSVVLSTGGKQTYWIDKSSYLLIRYQRLVVGMMGDTELIRDLSDYREVAGVKYPFKYESTFGANTYTTLVKSIRVNEPLEDAVFGESQ